ncbi:MAG TPA: nucleobase:cation symporter-2 family protein [Amaricoccus sp.]|uniref:uracil-xanthine permease family protein n=1 Tax=Amaricoccus sp. TaxID=1872485 RepID=UPI002CCB9215|nr:nucleobase:cation symporter-2 family protein [Amaricoccus sp.]HMQ92738.1 nucleobase:cation symporter-2 family protein [Amaricoccus sp.]HMR53714.1 nucleobase:cation symporter-2 family protein [Amaricoccus sp.]HMR59759.1 nucleobase:cation symporter-2 family protein [Amaricoccus sp.]HMT98945.1 nucleobase:cation symporter-2 family protein [Amaricoccus sp.]
MEEKTVSGILSHEHTKAHLTDVNYMPPLIEAVPLGIQHVLAMFVGNVTPALIIASAIDAPAEMRVFLVQAAMFVAGVATLVQTLGLGPIGAKVPIVMGTSFGFVPVIIPIAQTSGLPAVMGACFVGGLAMALVGFFIRHVRFLFPAVVTGTFVLLIGIILLPVGFAYVGGGFGAEDFGAPRHLWVAFLVFCITVGINQFTKGFLSEMGVLLGIVAGYLVAIPLGMVNFSSVGTASWVALPQPFAIGLEFVPVAIIGVVVMSIVTSAESIGDIAGTVIGGANRQPTSRELSGGVMADGLASSFAAIFNAFPQISFSQNVGLVALTGVASRYVVAIGGGFLLIAGLFPKVGAFVTTIPNAVLGGAVIIMFGMIASAGIKMLSLVDLNKRNMIIIGVSVAVAIGLRGQPALYEHTSAGVKAMLESGLIPGAVAAIVLNLILPGKEVIDHGDE